MNKSIHWRVSHPPSPFIYVENIHHGHYSHYPLPWIAHLHHTISTINTERLAIFSLTLYMISECHYSFMANFQFITGQLCPILDIPGEYSGAQGHSLDCDVY